MSQQVSSDERHPFAERALEGKVIVITGGGTGLGRTMTAHFVRHGARCVISGRRGEVLRNTAGELDPGGEAILPVVCDVRSLDDVERLKRECEERFGPADVLVNNAASQVVRQTEKLTPNAFRLVSDVVLMGTVNSSLTFGKHWIESCLRGTILNILTIYASTGSPFVVPSACAKAGVEAMTRSLAAEWGKYGIRVLGIAPGPFPTPGAMDRLLLDERWVERARSQIPMQRFGEHDEFGNLATFLISGAADYISGTVIRIDGAEAPYLAGEFSFLDKMSDEQWREHQQVVRKRFAGPRRNVSL